MYTSIYPCSVAPLTSSLSSSNPSTPSTHSQLAKKLDIRLKSRESKEKRMEGTHQNLRFLDFSLRLAVLPFTAASIWVMAKNNQEVESYGKVEFFNLSGLMYLVWINAISVGYALASLLLIFFRWFNSDWLLFIMDQVAGYLLLTSGSAVIEILYVAHEGDRIVSWSEVCSYYGSFCSRTKVSLVLHLMALLCFIALSLISGYRVFSKFEPPSALSSNEDVSKEVALQGE